MLFASISRNYKTLLATYHSRTDAAAGWNSQDVEYCGTYYRPHANVTFRDECSDGIHE